MVQVSVVLLLGRKQNNRDTHNDRIQKFRQVQNSYRRIFGVTVLPNCDTEDISIALGMGLHLQVDFRWVLHPKEGVGNNVPIPAMVVDCREARALGELVR